MVLCDISVVFAVFGLQNYEFFLKLTNKSPL